MYCINLLKLNASEFGQFRPVASNELKAFLNAEYNVISICAITPFGLIKFPNNESFDGYWYNLCNISDQLKRQANESYAERNETVDEFMKAKINHKDCLLIFDKQTAEMMMKISPKLFKDFKLCELQPFKKTIDWRGNTDRARDEISRLCELHKKEKKEKEANKC